MQSTDIHRMLVYRIRRGQFLSQILCVASAVSCIVAVICLNAWAVSFFIAALISIKWASYMHGRSSQAQKVAESSDLIYWGHPTSGNQILSNDGIDTCTCLLLHLKDGTEFTADLPITQMALFIDWLRERNPLIRFGKYDSHIARTSDGSISFIKSTEIHRILISCRIGPGLIISSVLLCLSVVWCCFSLAVGPRGAVPAYLVSVWLYINAMNVRKKNQLAQEVAKSPQLVYWAHSASERAKVMQDAPPDCTMCILHLRNGAEFEVDLPRAKMRIFIAWLVESNPSVRLGEYDKAEGTPP